MVTYNHEAYIAQAIESVLMQDTSFPVELVIGEDCSTDGTRAIVKGYAERYPGIIRALLHDRNVGMQANGLGVLAAARGGYIALLDGDDYWTDPAKLQRQVDFLDHSPDFSLCFHSADMQFHQDGELRHWQYPQQLTQNVFETRDLFCDNFIPTGSIVFRRYEDFKLPGWFFGCRFHDFPLMLLLSIRGKFKYLDGVMSVYRVHGGGATTGLQGYARVIAMTYIYESFNAHTKYQFKDQIFQAILTEIRNHLPDLQAPPPPAATLRRLREKAAQHTARAEIAPLDHSSHGPFWSVMIVVSRPDPARLRRSLESVLQQDPGPVRMQIEVVDDGPAADEVAELVRLLADQRVDFYRRPGPPDRVKALNTAIQRARGKWVHLLTGDEYVWPGFYDHLVELAAAHPQASLLATRTLWGVNQGVAPGPAGGGRFREKLVTLPEVLREGEPLTIGATVVKKEYLVAQGGYGPEFGPAYALGFWAKLAANYEGLVSSEFLCSRTFAADSGWSCPAGAAMQTEQYDRLNYFFKQFQPPIQPPIWSVIVPVSRLDPDGLRKTLESVLAQDPGPLKMQIEVLDDTAAGGAVAALVQEVAGDRIAVHQLPALTGWVGAGNAGIGRARGEWLHIIPPGDFIMPGFYEQLDRLAREHPAASLVATRAGALDGQSVAQPGSGRGANGGRDYDLAEALFAGIDLPLVGALVRRDYYARHGGFYSGEAADVVLEKWVQLTSEATGRVAAPFLASHRGLSLSPMGRGRAVEPAGYDRMNFYLGRSASSTTVPFWSVVVSAGQAPTARIRQALESVLAQDPGPLQMQIEVVSSAARRAEVAELVHAFAGDRVAVFAAPPEANEPAGYFNAAIQRVRGRWVHILPPDDYVRPDCYDRMARVIQSQPAAELVAAEAYFLDAQDRIMGPTQRWSGLAAGATWRDTLLERPEFVPASVVVQRAYYLQHGGFNLGFPGTADYELWAKAMVQARACAAEAVLVCHRPGGAEPSKTGTSPVRDLEVCQRLNEFFARSITDYNPERAGRQIGLRARSRAGALLRAGDWRGAHAHLRFYLRSRFGPVTRRS